MNILIYNIKGGVGKTTISDELMFSFEREGISAAYIDLDDQQSSSHTDQTADADTADLVVIDTPGARSQDVRAWMENADVIVIPTNASARDVPMMLETLEAARICAPAIPRIIVVNRYNRNKAATEFMSALEDTTNEGEIICSLPNAEAFQQACIQKKSVLEVAPKTSAGYCTLKTVNAIRKAVGLKSDPIDLIPIKTYLDKMAEQAKTRRRKAKENN